MFNSMNNFTVKQNQQRKLMVNYCKIVRAASKQRLVTPAGTNFVIFLFYVDMAAVSASTYESF